MFDFIFRRNRNDDRAALAAPADPAALEQAAPLTPPTIGLALGGGAARGFAHIGVLRTLMAKGIRPDVITGTSIGAVVGAIYATGHLDAFEEWARSLTRRSIFGYLDFAFSGSGLINGGHLAERLSQELGDITIEELPVRFGAIATELGTGHEIWLTRGRLVDALRAAYALPGVFTPVRVGPRWLVDGALVNPVPISTARAFGARLVIGVNLNADLFGRGTTVQAFGGDDPDESWLTDLRRSRGFAPPAAAGSAITRKVLGAAVRPGLITIMTESFNIMQDRITRARLAGDPPDVMVAPLLRDLGLVDFHRAAEAIELGAEAAERALGPIEEALAALA